jgi:ribose transport system permease protein
MKPNFRLYFADYGMVLVLLVLGAYYSWVTWEEQHPTGNSAASQLSESITEDHKPGSRIMIVARANEEDRNFSQAIRQSLEADGMVIIAEVNGEPGDARKALEQAQADGIPIDVIIGNHVTMNWAVFNDLASRYSVAANTHFQQPESYYWPNFLKQENLLNVANQIVVIAIIAIGMTMVIITAGIDLSVGSLIALSAVICAWLIREAGGGPEATTLAMTMCCLAAILCCGLLGAFSGLMITQFAIPPFIVTLGMMLVGSGLAFIIADGQSIYQLPDSFVWLGRGDDFLGLPNAVFLMILLYGIAHIAMTKMRIGRYIYAAGGNATAARLSGVPVKKVLVTVYTCCGCLAGLGGVITASQLKSGSPTYGLMYELYVIAAVVVGGTSLAGGEGKILGTLIGAFIIAVIQNGMNLTGVESYTQKVVLGMVILGAVLLDRLKKFGWRAFRAS